MKVIAFIPARAGSKGIPNKNLIDVAGKPLIQWTIEAAQKSNKIDTVVVTSDGDSILDFSKKFKGITILKRPNNLALDNTPTVPVILHAIEELKISADEYSHLILLQPTSPLRDDKDIDKAIQSLNNSNATALISVVEPNHHPLKSFVKNSEGFLEGLVNNTYPFTPRQELPDAYLPNGAIYIVNLKAFKKYKSFFTDKTIQYIMSVDKSIDVDTTEDIKQIENQLKYNPLC